MSRQLKADTSPKLRARGRRSPRGRSIFFVYVSIGIFLMLLDRVSPPTGNWIRALATDIASPVLTALATPIAGVQDGLERMAGVSDVYQENQRLRQRVARLEQWQETARLRDRENEDLRALLKVPGREAPLAATARVVGVGGGAFERNVVINAGKADGVGRNMPVVNVEGLVGRIVFPGQFSARVLLISDLNSRVPVRSQRTGALGMVLGTNGNRLELDFYPESVTVRKDDIFLTSGHGGLFPADIPVARVTKVERGFIELAPLAFLDRLDRLRVIAFDSPPPEAVPADAPIGLTTEATGRGN